MCAGSGGAQPSGFAASRPWMNALIGASTELSMLWPPLKASSCGLAPSRAAKSDDRFGRGVRTSEPPGIIPKIFTEGGG